MSLEWRKCLMCNGMGEIQIRKTRVQRITDKEKNPLIEDELIKCPNCDGKGNIYTKTSPLNPWNSFRKNENE